MRRAIRNASAIVASCQAMLRTETIPTSMLRNESSGHRYPSHMNGVSENEYPGG